MDLTILDDTNCSILGDTDRSILETLAQPILDETKHPTLEDNSILDDTSFGTQLIQDLHNVQFWMTKSIQLWMKIVISDDTKHPNLDAMYRFCLQNWKVC